MPIVAQSIFERKKLCPTVFETFGEHIDVSYARCSTKTHDKFYWKKELYKKVCAAEFCYLWDPYTEFEAPNFFNVKVPWLKTINLELFNNFTEQVVDIKNAIVGDEVRCKFCHVTVGSLLKSRMIELDNYDRYVLWGDKTHESINNSEQKSKMERLMKSEAIRAACIPLMIAKYKRLNNIL